MRRQKSTGETVREEMKGTGFTTDQCNEYGLTVGR